MKPLLVLLSLFMFLAISGCGCKNEKPTVMLQNLGTDKASIQIKTNNGNTENINNVEPGWKSDNREFASGEIIFTVTVQGVTEPTNFVLSAESCTDYIVTINSNNTVSSTKEER